MSTSTIEALASAWARIAEEAEFPADYEGTATPQAHRASEAIRGSRDFPSKNDKVLWRPRRLWPPEGYYFFRDPY
ncbi:hypothetical protein ACMWKN_24850, partial [Enterobacter sp. 01-M-05-SI-ECC]